MKSAHILNGDWKEGRSSIKTTLSIIVFEEDENYVMYCPALDLSGYGKDENEAYESFKVVLDEYFRYTTNKDTLKIDLKSLGWHVPKSKQKKASPPSMQHLLSTNDNFCRIFNDHAYKKIDKSFDIPALA
ncbi:MAG: hypothetical protein HC896_14400 [Bacteroidales bacterium]|nr:hypothetical protein [Bacteroidales bacterium]